MQREIQSLSGHPIICGHGRSGRAAAHQLVSAKAQLVIMDQRSAAKEESIEIRGKVPQDRNLDDTRLIFFTADDNSTTRGRAMDTEANAVVVKSPDAQEIIETAIKIIN